MTSNKQRMIITSDKMEQYHKDVGARYEDYTWQMLELITDALNSRLLKKRFALESPEHTEVIVEYKMRYLPNDKNRKYARQTGRALIPRRFVPRIPGEITDKEFDYCG